MNAQESISTSGFPQGTGAMTLGVKEPGALAFLDKITQTATAAHAKLGNLANRRLPVLFIKV